MQFPDTGIVLGLRPVRNPFCLAAHTVGYSLLAFFESCGMISGFMNPETQQPGDAGAARKADVYDLLAWFEVNKTKVGVALIALVVLGFVTATLRYMSEQKEAKASAALLDLKPSLVQQTNLPAVQASALLKVADDYKGTAAANRALLLAATALFTEGKYVEAEKEFTRLLQEHNDGPWAADAAYGQGAALEAQNKTNEAFAKYQAVATQYANSGVAEQAKLALARMHEARNQPDQALKIYNELAPASAPGVRASGSAEAYRRRTALLKEHPELNALSATVTAPASVTSSNAVPAAVPAN